jgi:hypothetical protein
MISAVELSWENRSLADWQDSQKRIESDPDSDLSDLVPKVSRLLGWLAEGGTAEQRGDRVTAMLFCIRPDFVEGRSLKFMSNSSKQNLSKLVVDFRATFGLRQSAHQAAKNSKV